MGCGVRGLGLRVEGLGRLNFDKTPGLDLKTENQNNVGALIIRIGFPIRL